MTFENLESVFKKSGRPYWYLYKGSGKGTVLASLNFEDGEKPEMDDSWSQLKEIMDEFDDGAYSIELRSSPTSSRGNPFISFSVGDDARAGKVSGGAASDHQPRNFLAGLDFRYFLERDSQQQNKIQQLQMDLLRQEFKMEQLKRESEEDNKPDVIGRIIGIVEKNPSVLTRLLGDQQGKAAIGVLKSEKKHIDLDDDEEDFDDVDDEPVGNISIDRAVNCLVRLQKVFPDLNVNQLLERLTDFCEDNPEQAKTILGSL